MSRVGVRVVFDFFRSRGDREMTIFRKGQGTAAEGMPH